MTNYEEEMDKVVIREDEVFEDDSEDVSGALFDPVVLKKEKRTLFLALLFLCVVGFFSFLFFIGLVVSFALGDGGKDGDEGFFKIITMLYSLLGIIGAPIFFQGLLICFSSKINSIKRVKKMIKVIFHYCLVCIVFFLSIILLLNFLT